METDAGPGCARPDGDSAVLLAEFRTWLDRERGLSPVSVRCYSKQSKAFLAGIGGAGAVSAMDAGRVTAFMVDWTQGRNTWSAKAMVTSLRAFLRFAHATGRTAAPLAGAVPAVASWQMSSLSRTSRAATPRPREPPAHETPGHPPLTPARFFRDDTKRIRSALQGPLGFLAAATPRAGCSGCPLSLLGVRSCRPRWVMATIGCSSLATAGCLDHVAGLGRRRYQVRDDAALGAGQDRQQDVCRVLGVEVDFKAAT
jgi:hypothetical protein